MYSEDETVSDQDSDRDDDNDGESHPAVVQTPPPPPKSNAPRRLLSQGGIMVRSTSVDRRQDRGIADNNTVGTVRQKKKRPRLLKHDIYAGNVALADVITNLDGHHHRKSSKVPVKKRHTYYLTVVVDYDLTLVDEDAKPFPGAKRFLRDVKNLNDANTVLVLYSHANAEHINHGLDVHFSAERSLFSEVLSDHTCVKNKPVTVVRRALKRIAYLAGPIAIVDDKRYNLQDDQYDITVDANRLAKRDRHQRVVGIDYGTVLCQLREGVARFLATKES